MSEFAHIRSLEPRRLFSAVEIVSAALEIDTQPPTIVQVRLMGGPVRSTGIRITFSEPLLRAVAVNRDNYALSTSYYDSKGPRDENFDGEDDNEWIPETEVRFREAIYRESDNSVLLRANRHFSPYKDMRIVKVRSGDAGLKDVAGNRLDGNKDGESGGIAILRFKTNYGRTVSYIDHDGDKVTLKLGRAGKIAVLQDMVSTDTGKKGHAIQVWLFGQLQPGSVLSGKIKPTSRGGDGHTTIRELLGTDGMNVKILDDPAFTVLSVGQPAEP